MDMLFRKRLMPFGKPQMKMFSKSQSVVVPSMMRRPLIGAGGAGIRRPAVM